MRFFLKLVAVFNQGYHPPNETATGYTELLSGYDLTDDQWDRVYVKLTRIHDKNGLPKPALIFELIYETLEPSRQEAAMRFGKMRFRDGAYEHVINIRLETDKTTQKEHWVIAKSGIDVDTWLSDRKWLVFIAIEASDPKRTYGEMPTAVERAGYIAEFHRLIEKITLKPKKASISRENDPSWYMREPDNRAYGTYLSTRSLHG